MVSNQIEQAVARVIEGLDLQGISRLQAGSAERFHAALTYEAVDRLPITYAYPLKETARWQPLPNRRIYQDPAAMLYNELVSAWGLHITERMEVSDDLPATIRPNWGTVTVASLIGLPPEQVDDQTPWIKRGERQFSLEEVRDLDVELETCPWVAHILETYRYYQDICRRYPEFGQAVTICLPDLQGPFDSLEQILGEQLFIDMVLNPSLVTDALMRLAELQTACVKLFTPYCTERESGYSHQHGTMIKGNVLIRNDSVVMISSKMYEEIVAPADEYILQEVQGGAIHSCGKIDHAADAMLSLKGMQSFDFGQSYMNDMSRIYERAREHHIALVRVQPDREELLDGSILEKYPTGVTLTFQAGSQDEARTIHQAYIEAAERRTVWK